MKFTTWSGRVLGMGCCVLAGALALGAAAPAPAPPSARAEEPAQPPGPPAGKPSLTVYFAKGFEDAAWQQGAFAQVAKTWAATAPPALGKKAVVISEIMRDGTVLDAKIGTPSGSEGWDKAAVAAVRKAAPFAALPQGWPRSSLEVHWHFEYAK